MPACPSSTPPASTSRLQSTGYSAADSGRPPSQTPDLAHESACSVGQVLAGEQHVGRCPVLRRPACTFKNTSSFSSAYPATSVTPARQPPRSAGAVLLFTTSSVNSNAPR